MVHGAAIVAASAKHKNKHRDPVETHQERGRETGRQRERELNVNMKDVFETEEPQMDVLLRLL